MGKLGESNGILWGNWGKSSIDCWKYTSSCRQTNGMVPTEPNLLAHTLTVLAGYDMLHPSDILNLVQLCKLAILSYAA